MAVAAPIEVTRSFVYLGRAYEAGEVLDPTPGPDLTRKLVEQRRARFVTESAPAPTEPRKGPGRRRST